MPDMVDQIAQVIQYAVVSGGSAWEEISRDVLVHLMNHPSNNMIERGDWVRGNHDNTWSEGNDTKSIFRSIIHEALTETWKQTQDKL